ncbi:VCBS repeat-containing protein [Roseimicrobium sp. ORNL1]|uniref:FG-GAP repeat domain-containing protein n=1 Tax=Roseimicrobium sp. ORNL1 TaxID=2711231 RepID=UPI0013E194B5|nr:VCBS repeat-containing protein [Roseimicrobium sp. ORNL1]QIF00057.1 VCBS repeat-containing protein [Roseimicrobium sp. ORNL1]
MKGTPTRRRRFAKSVGFLAGIAILGGAGWWFTRNPYDALIGTWNSAKSEQLSGWAVSLGDPHQRLLAMASEDGTLQVFREESSGWREIWRDAFPKRTRDFFVNVPRDESRPKNWWEKALIKARRVYDPEYQMDMAGAGNVVTRKAFKPKMLFADLNGDAILDLVVADERLWLLEGTAEGGFSRVWESPERFSSDRKNLAAQDLDGDGKPEVMLLNYLSARKPQPEYEWNSLLIYSIKPESQKWQVQRKTDILLTDSHGSHSTSSLLVGDFDGDKQMEILVANDNGSVWVLEIRDGMLTQVGNAWRVPQGGACNLGSGDLNGDGRPEMLVGTNGGNIYACAVNTDGSIRVLGTTMAGRLAYCVCGVDVNGDGTEEMMAVRGMRGYADMKKEDVMAELWTLDEKAGTLVRRWGQQVPVQEDPMVTNLDGGPPEVLILHGKYRPRVLRPEVPETK